MIEDRFAAGMRDRGICARKEAVANGGSASSTPLALEVRSHWKCDAIFNYGDVVTQGRCPRGSLCWLLVVEHEVGAGGGGGVTSIRCGRLLTVPFSSLTRLLARPNLTKMAGEDGTVGTE